MMRIFQLLVLFATGILIGCQNAPVEDDATNNSGSAAVSAKTPLSTDQQDVPVADEIARLNDQLESDLAALQSRVDAAESEQAKIDIFENENPVPQFVKQMIQLSTEHRESKAAVDAALAAVSRAKGKQQDQAMANLLEHFCDQLQLKKITDSIADGVPSPQKESQLLQIVRNSSKPEFRAYGMMEYCNYVDRIVPFKNALAANPGLLAKLPPAQIEYLNQQRSEQQIAARIDILQQLIDEFGDLKYRGGTTYGDIAAGELYELKHLRVGQIAPDIEGTDLDGMEFRLSDYRGKVVMLDFWGHWCRPCRRMYPHERQLVQRLSHSPFVLLGVNTDRDQQTAIDAVSNDNLSWRNFWDGPQGTDGPISKRWNITAWPTVYLIDGDGVIRHKDILGEDLNAALQELLAEMGHQHDLAGIQ